MLKEFKGIQLPSESEFVIIDSTVENPKLQQQTTSKIPIRTWIDYNKAAPNPPMMTFLINPSTMTSSFSKKVNTSFSRGGYIVEEWGENLDVLNLSGSIGGYYVLKSDLGDITGLSRYDRNRSISFRNLMELFLIYRNNGAIFQNTIVSSDDNTTNKLIESNIYSPVSKRVPASVRSIKNKIVSLGDVYLQYDQTIYYGSYDNFSIIEDASKPFNLSFSFSFTVLRRKITDKREFSYYNQVATEFENYDLFTGKSGNSQATKNITANYLHTQKDSSDQEAKTNPPGFPGSIK